MALAMQKIFYVQDGRRQRKNVTYVKKSNDDVELKSNNDVELKLNDDVEQKLNDDIKLKLNNDVEQQGELKELRQ